MHGGLLFSLYFENLPTALVWGLLPSLALLALVWWIDRYEKEPTRLLLVALLFGVVGAASAAGLIEWVAGIRSSFFAADLIPRSALTTATPIVEEAARGGAILLVFALVRREVDNALDGLLYGATVGVGFGLTAEFVGILRSPFPDGASASALFPTTIASLHHVFYGAVIGLALGFARRGSVRTLLLAGLAGIAAAAGFHLLHDYMPWWAATATGDAGPFRRSLDYLPNGLGLLALAAMMTWASGREKLLVARELHGEIKTGVVTADDYERVTNPFRRLIGLASALVRRGHRAWRLQRRIYALEVELAFRKHHNRAGNPQALRLRDEEAYRAEILEARATMARA